MSIHTYVFGEKKIKLTEKIAGIGYIKKHINMVYSDLPIIIILPYFTSSALLHSMCVQTCI